jgi:SAM-dependent methyltransferase
VRNSIASKTFRFDEAKYYRFGLAMGIANVPRNGLRLGLKKTLGKVLQPINSYTRFPEYHFLECQMKRGLQDFPSTDTPIRILDVGSPKCFGLYLAFYFNIEIHLTDIDAASVNEAEILWDAIKRRARGKALFSLQDARALKYSNQEFDIVYSMSVIEHVEGQAGDSKSMREMVRVLKPGGLLLVTVPVGQKYVEQERVGFQGAARTTGDRNRYFFQRIYTPLAAEERIIDAVPGTTLRNAVTVCRKRGIVSNLYRRLGTDVRGLLGCFNPILSAVLNDSRQGVCAAPGNYGSLHSGSDVYGDLMLAWEKKAL